MKPTIARLIFIVTLLQLGTGIARGAEADPLSSAPFRQSIRFSPETIDSSSLPPEPAFRNENAILTPSSAETLAEDNLSEILGQAEPSPSDAIPLQPSRSLHRQAPGEQPFIPERLPFRPRPNPTEDKTFAASPSVTIMTPSGYGAGWGSAGVGIGLQERTRFTDEADGVAGFGIGFGNPRKNVGLTVGVTVTDLWGDTFEDGTLSLKLHRLLPYDLSVAAGVQGALTWGETDGGSSIYGAVTKRFILREPSEPLSQVYVSLGIGGGQYRSESDIEDGEESVGAFGAIAVRLVEPVSAIAEWTGQDMTVGFSVTPFRNIPLVISPAITDITGSAGDGTRFILGIGYGFSFDRL